MATIIGTNGSDTLTGTASNDVINAAGGHDQLFGLQGDDTLNGGLGRDTLTGGAGRDVIDGGSGDDLVSWAAGDGNDTIAGGTNVDTLVLAPNAAGVLTSLHKPFVGTEVLVFSGGELLRVSGIEHVIVQGGAGPDNLSIGNLAGAGDPGGSITFTGGAGDDAVMAHDGVTSVRLHLSGGDGNDQLVTGGEDGDTLLGEAGDDTLRVNGGGTGLLIDGGSGDDLIVLRDLDGAGGILLGREGVDTLRLDTGVMIASISKPGFLFELQTTDGSFFGLSGQTSAKQRIEIFDFAEIGNLGVLGSGTYTFTALTSGGAGNDLVVAQGMNVTLKGREGDDFLFGSDGNDVLLGAVGNDVMSGSMGTDTLDGGDGFDVATYASAFSGVTVDLRITALQDVGGGQGNDRLLRVEGLIGSTHHDILTGDDEANLLIGLAGNDLIHGEGGDDRLMGGAGNDDLVGGAGNDTLLGEAGDDMLFASGGIDILIGAAGNDLLTAGRGIGLLSGGDGADSYRFGATDGLVVLNDLGASTGDTLELPADAHIGSLRMTRAGDGTLSLGTPALESFHTEVLILDFDGIHGGQPFGRIENVSFDPLGLGTATCAVQDGGTAGNDAIFMLDLRTATAAAGSGGDDLIFGNSLAGNLLDGGDGDDVLVAQAAASLQGGTGNDMLFGSSGNDALSGGDGDDMLDAGFGGDDSLSGGAGNDLFRVGGGDVVLVDSSGTDTLELGGGFVLSSISIAGNDMIVEGVGGHAVAISGQLSGAGIERFLFADDPLGLLPGAGYAFTTGAGTAGRDLLLVTSGAAASVTGGDGDDLIVQADGGGRTLEGGAGDDLILPGDGFADTVSGGAGTDIVSFRGAGGGVFVNLAGGTAGLLAGGGTTTLIGMEGAFGSAFADSLTGSAGNDVLDGGGGADQLAGGNGDDRYLLDLADGADTVSDSGGLDTIEFRNRLTGHADPFEVDMTRAGADLVITLGTGDNVRIIGQTSGGAVERFFFAGDDVLRTFAASGTAGNDLLVGDGGKNGLNGGDGDDLIYGGNGADKLIGGNGDDILHGGKRGDLLQGGAGDDRLFGGSDVDTLEGGAGNDWLDGGLGDDRLAGGDGDDVYVVTRENAATDTIMETAGFDSLVVDDDGATIGAATARSGLSGNDLELSFESGGATFGVVVQGQFAGTAVELIEIGGRQYHLAADLDGTDAPDLLVGTEAAETIVGGRGGDIIFGGAGDDTIDGGFEADTLFGGDGADTFFFMGIHDVLYIDGNTTLDALFPGAAPTDHLVDFVSGTDKIAVFAGPFGTTTVDAGNFEVISGPYDGTNGTTSQYALGNATLIYSQADGALFFDLNGDTEGYNVIGYVGQPVAADFVLWEF